MAGADRPDRNQSILMAAIAVAIARGRCFNCRFPEHGVAVCKPGPCPCAAERRHAATPSTSVMKSRYAPADVVVRPENGHSHQRSIAEGGL
jgi:hypothetical protein